MRYLIIIGFLMFSCNYTVTPEEWKKCEQLCKSNDGMEEYNADVGNRYSCYCKNGLRGNIK